jgi:stalled ribosome rescue protein Dom34
MDNFHAVVWIDHNEAHVIHFKRDADEELNVRSRHRKGHLHHNRGQIGSGRVPEDQQFFDHVSAALTGAKEILIVGPASAKDEFGKHLRAYNKTLAATVVGFERVDHPTDGQLLKFARHYFHAIDQMGPAPGEDLRPAP